MRPPLNPIYFFLMDVQINYVLNSWANKFPKFLFVIDCRGEVNEQFQFAKDAKEYIALEIPHKTLDFYYMSFNKTSVYLLPEQNIDTDILEPNCSTILPLNDLMKKSESWLLDESKALRMAFLFIYNFTHDDAHYKTFEKYLLKLPSNIKILNRFFIIQTYENMQSFSQQKHIYFHKSLKKAKFKDIFSKYTNKSCPISNLNKTFQSSQRSFYYVTKKINMSQKDGRLYCIKHYNSYLLSLETFEEMEFITHFVRKNLTGKNVLHIGLRVLQSHSMRLLSIPPIMIWLSQNPFLLKTEGQMYEKGTCFMFDVEKYKLKPIFLKNENYSINNYMNPIKCQKKINPSLVICECHTTMSRDYDISTYLNNDFNVFESTTLFVHFDLFIKKSNFLPLSIVHNKCNPSFNYSHDNFKYFVCNKHMHKSNKMTPYQLNTSTINQSTDFLVELNPLFLEKITINLLNCVGHVCRELIQKSESFNKVNSSLLPNVCPDAHKNESKSVHCTQSSALVDLNFGEINCEKRFKKRDFRCVKIGQDYCNDNLNLQNCEEFTCHKGFFKCPQAYCIPFSDLGNFINDCPHGEDELIFHLPICVTNIKVSQSTLCVHRDVDNETLHQKNFICPFNCPYDYMCISNTIVKDDSNITIQFSDISTLLFNVSNLFLPRYWTYLFSFKHVVFFQGSNCNIVKFDKSFQLWPFSELLVLDLSFNDIVSSNDLSSVSQFTKLKLLNLSYNLQLEINDHFQFPDSLTVIDLSYTRINSLSKDIFQNLNFLQHLNLSTTLIQSFKDMGLPKYFKLDTFYIKNLDKLIIEQNIFQGLTIETGLWASDHRLCCPQILNSNISVSKCHAPIDVISSCKHLVGDLLRRAIIWVVAIVTIFGNGVVLVYRHLWKREVFKRAYGLFVTGLAFSDLIMGIYLIIISSVDIYYKDVYVLEETQWKQGWICAMSGFLSTLSSETSTVFICLITLDRYLSITYPFGDHTLSKCIAWLIFWMSWLISSVLALVPVFVSDWEIYSSNGLCLALPFSAKLIKGWEFSFIVFVGFNFGLFIIIAIGQIAIFVNITRKKANSSYLKDSRKRRLEDSSVAKKLALVALTDFLCWFPIGIIGFLSFKGHIFDRDVYAWIAVFVLPINSALNPIIYTIPAIIKQCRK